MSVEPWPRNGRQLQAIRKTWVSGRETVDFHFVVQLRNISRRLHAHNRHRQGALSRLSNLTQPLTVRYSTLSRPSDKIDSKENIIFEDANFKAYLVANFDTDGDGEISKEEALAITKIIVGTKDISLAGIEHMANLTELRCEGPWSILNQEEDPEELENPGCVKKRELDNTLLRFQPAYIPGWQATPKIEQSLCKRNLNSLDIQQEHELIEFEAYNNRLSSIDVSNNPELEYIDLTNNQIKSIDVNSNPELDYRCDNNQIKSIDVARTTELERITCSDNKLTSIGVQIIGWLHWILAATT